MPSSDTQGNHGKLIIYCVGNIYRSDDAVGPIISENLRKQNLHGVKLLEIDNDGLSIIQEWSNNDKVIIVDASFSNQPAGTIFRFDLLREQVPYSRFNFSTHNLNFADTIKLAKQLDNLPTELRLFAIEGKSFNLGTEVTPEVIEASNVVSKEIIELCRSWLKKD